MFIKALAVEGIGRFGTAAHVDGFGEGVNVLAAGNEVGKSTLFKAIRTCLFCRHDSKIQEIRDLGSDGSQLPATVQLTFVRQGRTYVIKKVLPAFAEREPDRRRPRNRAFEAGRRSRLGYPWGWSGQRQGAG